MKNSVLFVNDSDKKTNFQSLSGKWTCIEHPVWSLLLAEACRKNGYGVSIFDNDAEQLDSEKAIEKIVEINPSLVCFVVYGSNPQAGICGMEGNIKLAQKLRREFPQYKIAFIGTYPSALPIDTLSYTCIDFVMVGDGFYALRDLLSTDFSYEQIKSIAGLGYKDQFGLCHTNNGCVVKNLDEELPGYAWDLLPNKNLYRSHIWHGEFQDKYRSPSAAIYTSLGCSFVCSFCNINSINRINFDGDKSAADFAGMRFWSPEKVLSWFKTLVEDFGVTTIRVNDEMFFLNRKYYIPILEGLISRGYGEKIKLWFYSRIDTCRKDQLELFKKAGTNFLALGIESANQTIRQEIDKGRFQEINIRDVVKNIRNAGINTIGNYIYGFPNDNWETMQQTLNLALELNTEMYNGYYCQNLPGSPLYLEAKRNNWELPTSFSEWSFHSYDAKPTKTNFISSADLVAFRDYAWQTYMKNPAYHALVKSKFGEEALSNIKEMASVPLKRKILGD